MAGDNPSGWVKGATWAFGIGFPVVIGGMLAYIAGMASVLHQLRTTVAANTEHVIQHDRQAVEWKERIVRNEDRVSELATNARARPDPFTGSDGRRLRALIDANERRLDQVERCCDKRGP